MSYALGQAKMLPGQINFMTTPSGRIPSLQPLIEAGLPIAPYIEHGSYATGAPAIMRYGRDPYRGLSGPEEDAARALRDAGQRAGDTLADTLASVLSPTLMIGTGAVVGAAAGFAGGLLKSALWGTLIGGVGGAALGYLAHKNLSTAAIRLQVPTPPAVSGLSGVLAVL